MSPSEWEYIKRIQEQVEDMRFRLGLVERCVTVKEHCPFCQQRLQAIADDVRWLKEQALIRGVKHEKDNSAGNACGQLGYSRPDTGSVYSNLSGTAPPKDR